MEIYSTKKINYAYNKTGNGEPILFAHGLFIDHSVFELQIESLKENHTCYSFDLPGHGLSDYNPKGWTLDDMVEDIASFIKDQNLNKPTLVGLSQGGMIFMRLAARHPQLVGRLVLVGSSYLPEYPERIQEWSKRIQILESGNPIDISLMLTKVQQAIVGPKFNENHPEERDRELKVMLSNKPEGLILATNAAVINRDNVSGELGSITCPTLIVCGSEDHATPLSISKEMQKLIRNSELISISNVGHHIPIECPDLFSKTLIDFIKTNPL